MSETPLIKVSLGGATFTNTYPADKSEPGRGGIKVSLGGARTYGATDVAQTASHNL